MALLLFSNYMFFFCYFRLYLAGMHFNENSNRPKATTSSGKPMYRLLFPKAKKGLYTIKPVTSNPTYCKFE